MTKIEIAKKIETEREALQQMINAGMSTRTRARQEQKINNLKAELAK